MEPFELLIIISNVFEKLKIPYFITGSIASITYGQLSSLVPFSFLFFKN